ncbi:MAG: DUF1853 family protein [Thiogranum sp.]|nr:DUF1853 family protein [Thiogranum sp.]
MSDEPPYRNPLVRDLAWSLRSPPLLQRIDRGVRWLDAEWFEQVTDHYSDYLLQLDSRPQALAELVNNRKDRRLGNYFETLWRFWLTTGDRYRLLYANLPLRSGERTLGEFDFLVRDTQTGRTLHWEVAVKFYLGRGNLPDPANWWGPARRDRLDIKTQRLLIHQSRLSRHEQARKLLAQLDVQVDESWLILKGRLHYPWGRSGPAPHGSHPGHLRGFWLHQSAAPQLEGSSWLVLERHQWLAPVTAVDAAACMTCDALLRHWKRHPLQRPLCIARISDGSEVERGFVVPDDWD